MVKQSFEIQINFRLITNYNHIPFKLLPIDRKCELYVVQHYQLSQIYHIYAETLLANTDDRQHCALLHTSIFYSPYSRSAYFTVCGCTDTLNYILGTHPDAVTSLTTFQMNLYNALGMDKAVTWELWKQHVVILLVLLWFFLPHMPYFFLCCLKF